MGLKVGIIGLANVGKSTLFNAILGRQQALTAPYPFATVEPNVGVVEVPDERLEKLRDTMFPVDSYQFSVVGSRSNVNQFSVSRSKTTNKPINRLTDKPEAENGKRKTDNRPPIVPATVTFVDIAGLVKGASQGQGLGNQFLGHIRDVDLILHVLRDFDEGIPRAADSKDPEYDAEIVRTELELKDLEIMEREKKGKREKNEKDQKDKKGEGKSQKDGTGILSKKPVIYAVNVGEDKLGPHNASLDPSTRPDPGSGLAQDDTKKAFFFCAKLEEEISKMPKNEQKEYLKIYGLERSCLDRIISECFQALGLISFFTAGPKEVRAWPVRRDSPAPKAAGVIHSDFERLFIRAEVIGWEKLAACGSWQAAKERGWVRTEGRDYIIKDGEVCNFLIGK